MEATQEKEKMPNWRQVVYTQEFKKNVRRVRAGKPVYWEYMRDEIKDFVDFDFTFFYLPNGYIFVKKQDSHHKAFLADILDEIKANGRVNVAAMIKMYAEYVEYTGDNSDNPFADETENDQP
jgi:hypothetical protein